MLAPRTRPPRFQRSETGAQRLIDPLAGRFWKIVNPSVRNRLGEPVGYKLPPGENVAPFAGREAAVTRRAGFMTGHFWVTRYHPRERYAAGDYPNQHPGGAGLPSDVQDDAPLENTDLVVWYTFGAHHVVRPEDWPVMPVTSIGFMLKPVGFFDRNPHSTCPGRCGTVTMVPAVTPVDPAARLQGGGDLSLAEVAAHAGFSDQSQFSHHFKRHFGVTPRQFRMSARIA